MGLLKAILTSTAFVVNTVFWTSQLYALSLLRTIIPSPKFRIWCEETMVRLAENWIIWNNRGLSLLHSINYRIEIPTDLRLDRSYLVMANHQSWVDIIVLQRALNREIPFLRFFLKHQLRYIPLLGGAWKALDYPFMKRHTRAYLEKHPEKRGEDLAATKRACDKLAGKNISIINFLEGTRFSPEKHSQQNSPFRYLLTPKAGGIAFVLQAMGQQFDALLDVTIFYPGKVPSMWDLLSGQFHEAVVIVEKRETPNDLLGGDYFGDEAFRAKLQLWLKNLWEAKDKRLEELRAKN